MENAPMVADAIAKYMGKSKGELKELSSDGAITADIIKNAMFMASDDINKKFETMPMTFTDIWNKIKNSSLQAFAPLIEATSNFINSDMFNDLLNNVIMCISLISTVIGGFINFFTSNWPIIQSLLIATAIYLAATLGPSFIAAGIAGLKSGLLTAYGWMVANAPMLLIIATIALVIYAFMQMGGTVEDICGFIGGVIGAAIAGAWNLFLALFEFLLGIVAWLVNPYITFANFLANVFSNPVSSIVYLFQGMADTVLGLLEKIASALDFVFGSNMADAVSGWRSGLKDMADAVVAEYAPNENYQKVMDTIDVSASDFGLERMSYTDSYKTGSKMGKKAYGTVSDKLGGLTSSLTSNGSGYDTSGFGTAGKPLNVKGTGSNGALKVDMSDEDLGYLRDLAERDYINKFSTATLAPNVTIKFGDVHETADADAVAGRIRTILQEEITTTAEGAYS